MSSISATLKNEKQEQRERLGELVLLKATRAFGGEPGDSPAARGSSLWALTTTSSSKEGGQHNPNHLPAF